MVLDAECIMVPVAEPGNRLVVQVAVRDDQLVGQRCFLNRETMILSRDLNLARFQVQDRLVRSPMAKLQLESLCAAR